MNGLGGCGGVMGWERLGHITWHGRFSDRMVTCKGGATYEVIQAAVILYVD